ncbi:MAG: recombination protein RecR [Phycisphaerae bacterium]|nr:recombination protein RecR [Phycisphaerae bacterium]
MQGRSRSYPDSVTQLIDQLSSLPGIGKRSAERLTFYLLKSSTEQALGLASAIEAVKREIRHCSICSNLTEAEPCSICSDPGRDASKVLLVEQPRDLMTLEETGMYSGVYHVLLGRLDPLDGIGPDSLSVRELLRRVEDPSHNCRGVKVEEVILGLNPDMDGDTTSLYLWEQLQKSDIKVTRLARGLPTGSQIEYANSAVLADAISQRQSL